MSSIPLCATAMIVAFVGIPAGIMRLLALLVACVIGTSWLVGTPTFFSLPGPLAFFLCLFTSVLAYLLTVAVEYVLAKYREAVPLGTLIQGIMVEVLVQTGGTIGVSMVLGGLFSDSARPLLAVFGPIICISTIVFAFTNSRRIKEWRAAWNGDYREIPPPLEDTL
ncbi:hypothetical protein OJ996_08460 [Luteolibacter sp. GHJ8]|uniref:Uncharacterized protein n=1 Tax=Luteolibacter rhizosphaerae TaxID=2989719 RepID=A0ABT3G277_9BACT|nr:hypothetical protein [Luteolibacter rhizosphaerae]MCW1913604.1 hypothetical protein [Luteolibacter rhizosphaerae]